MKDRLQEFAAMWGEDAGRYGLVRTDPSSEGVSSCDIFDKADRTGMIIEDDDLAAKVMRRMVAAGVPILDRAPDA
jgi:hypothetical protein